MNSGVARHLAWIAAGYLGAVGVVLACNTTLDPSVLAGEEAGGAGSGGAPLAWCLLVVDTQERPQYEVCPNPLDFHAAAIDCVRRGATLAGVGSELENEVIAAIASLAVSTNLWLGGMRDDEYIWRWRDGSVFWRGGPGGAAEGNAFAHWAFEEPNDSSMSTTEPERCLALVLDASDWNDRACSLSLPYVCEHTGSQ
jgi:hypothetical protein